ncbi:alpha/beta hydrolase [Sphaerisporangium sp. NPDC049002]|uniref:alpha/beta fold hydrolase n=1 Tax=unclassified Sphaerisporangium TaxID=2630420 RepID=UPI0033F04B54
MPTTHKMPTMGSVPTRHGVPTTLIDDSRGGKLAVTQLGDPSGTPVFFLHGTPGCRIGPLPKTASLFRQRIRLICFDRPGYGDSSRAEDRRVSDGAFQVKAVADELGLKRFAVVGRSGGGPHALACAALLPDRVTRAAALVTLAPPDAEDLDWFGDMAESNIQEYKAAELGASHLADYLEPVTEELEQLPTRLIRGFFHELPQSDRRIVANSVVRKSLSEGYVEALKISAGGWIDDGVAFRSAWGFDPADISIPVRLWHGEEDVFSPVRHTEWLAKRIPKAEALIQPAVGHFSALYALPSILAWLTADRASFL